MDREAYDLAVKMFKIRIDGNPSSRSQFGHPYWKWANGEQVPEAGRIPLKGSRFRVLSLFQAELKRQRKSFDVLVWRTMPEYDGRCLSVRWHFMSSEELLRDVA